MKVVKKLAQQIQNCLVIKQREIQSVLLVIKAAVKMESTRKQKEKKSYLQSYLNLVHLG